MDAITACLGTNIDHRIACTRCRRIKDCIITSKTYRHRAHTERVNQPDDRPPEEIAYWLERDPIERLVSHLQQQQGQLSEHEWQAMDQEILARIESAVAFARSSPLARIENVEADVFAP